MTNPPKTYVFDLDGVIYRGSEAQPHASETVQELKSRGHKIHFFTNNSRKTREDYQTKLAGMGISIGNEKIMTSSYATALYLRENGKPDGCALVVGESGIVHELESIGIRIVQYEDVSSVDYVVVGVDRQFNYDKLTQAQQAILAGAKFIATNRDATFPIENGRIVPGGGAIVSAIETASGIKPILIGKPESYALDKILELDDTNPSESIIIGDRLETDILVGNRLGMRTVLVLTGVSDECSAKAAPPDMKPERIISDLIELIDESWLTQ